MKTILFRSSDVEIAYDGILHFDFRYSGKTRKVGISLSRSELVTLALKALAAAVRA